MSPVHSEKVDSLVVLFLELHLKYSGLTVRTLDNYVSIPDGAVVYSRQIYHLYCWYQQFNVSWQKISYLQIFNFWSCRYQYHAHNILHPSLKSFTHRVGYFWISNQKSKVINLDLAHWVRCILFVFTAKICRKWQIVSYCSWKKQWGWVDQVENTESKV